MTSASLFVLASLLSAGSDTRPAVLNQVIDQSFNHGEVVETVEHLTDVIGPRLTNSPAMRQAETWSESQFRSWGLSNVHREGFEFGRGWWIEEASVKMTLPRQVALRAIPVAWTPATAGVLRAPIIVAPLTRVEDFGQWRGKLAGRIILISDPAPEADQIAAPFQRYDASALTALEAFDPPLEDPAQLKVRIKRRLFADRLDRFLKEEGAIAWARMSLRGNGLVHGEGYCFERGGTPTLPGVEIAAEDYRRLARLAKLGPVQLAIDSRVHFEDTDQNAYNIIADLPGRESNSGYVMAGAHLDSWMAADGAADNGAGAAVIMEAARILSALHVEPRRTIRFALWAGEEQGLLGSFAYVEEHIARRPPASEPGAELYGPRAKLNSYPITLRPGYGDLVAYFNIDHGSGRIRGLYTERNSAAIPMLRKWLEPLAGLGASTVADRSVPGSDHFAFASVGVPAFLFLQDKLDYESQVHHSSLDTFDHLRPDELRQAAAVVAMLLLDAANAEEPVPRAALPSKPKISNPFSYAEPGAQ